MRMIARLFVFTCIFLFFSQVNAQVTNFALKLDGTDKVTCGQISELNGKQGYTVQFLIAPEPWASNAYIFQRGKENVEFSARLSSTPGEVIFKVGGQEIIAVGVATTGWTQLSFVASPNGADIWVNGTKVGNANNNLLMPTTTDALILGEGFRGRLDEFRLWNTEIAGTESENLMSQNTVNKFHPKWDNLVLYYKFDQDQCLGNIVDYKLSHHGSMVKTIQREAVTDNNYFRYRVVTGYSDYNRHCDRVQIDRDMHLLTNDLIMLISHVDGNTGNIIMANSDNGAISGGASYLSKNGDRSGVLKLDGTGSMNIGKNIIRAGAPAAISSTFEGWFNISQWVEGACLLRKEENAKKYVKICLGKLDAKELIVEANGWKATFSGALEDINKWQHLAIVLDPTTRAKMQLYVNNSECKTKTMTKPEGQSEYDILHINADALIGENFVGMMDEVMIWRNSRSSFADDMEGTSSDLKFPGGGYNSIFLDAYWKFDKESDLGLNIRSWQGVIGQIKEQYCDHRGFKVRIGLGATEGWQSGIVKKEWRDNLTAGVAKLEPYCDGFDVDFEWLDNNQNNPGWTGYGEMMKALREVIPTSKVFSVSLHPVSYTLPKSALPYVDYITFQNYGPRPTQLYFDAYSSFFTRALDYGIPAEKIHLSMATTIVKTDNSGKDVRGYTLLDPSTITEESNKVDHAGVSYTFNGVNEVKKKMKLLVDNNAGGCMYFDMGNDMSVQHELSLTRALNSVISSNVDLLVTDVNDIPGTGIENELISKKSEIKVYPNPAKDFVIIEGSFGGEMVKYELSTISGMKVKVENSSNNKVVIGLNDFSKGMYLLHINNGKESVTKKIQVK